MVSKYYLQITVTVNRISSAKSLENNRKLGLFTPQLTPLTCSKSTLETRKRCEICSKLIVKTPGQIQERRFSVFIVTFEHNLHLFLVFLSLTFNK